MTKNRNKQAHILRKLAEDIKQKSEKIENLADQGIHKVRRGRRNVERHLRQMDDGFKLMTEALYKKRILEEPLPDILLRIAKSIENDQ